MISHIMLCCFTYNRLTADVSLSKVNISLGSTETIAALAQSGVRHLVSPSSFGRNNPVWFLTLVQSYWVDFLCMWR